MIRWNETSGNGYANPADDYGIGIVSGNNKLIEANTAIGNTHGIVELEILLSLADGEHYGSQ